MEEKKRVIVIGGYMVALIILGILWPGSANFIEDFSDILFARGILITDFFETGSIPAALINSGLVGIIGIALVCFSRTTMSGPTIAAVFTLAGFALFGKTPINVWPVILGVAISAFILKEHFKNLLLVAMFGTALGPVVSLIAFGLGWGYWAGVSIGVVTGIILPALATHLLHTHQGFSLYNVGFTCGFVGMYVTGYLQMQGHVPEMPLIWHEGSQLALGVVFTVYFASMVVLGWPGRKRAVKLWKLPGTLVTDFVTEQGFRPTIFNMGLVGLMGMLYIYVVGGVYNGPSLGGVFTMVGFAAFGKHVRNVWPIMAGIYIGSLISVWEAVDPGPLLAALFGTTLAPIAGRFGWLIGIFAGIVHLSVVMLVGPFHGGMNLYNNGFAGGLVGTLFIGISRWFYGFKR